MPLKAARTSSRRRSASVMGLPPSDRGWSRGAAGSGRGSGRLPELLAGPLCRVELGGERLGRARAERLLDELAGLAALGPDEAPGLDGRLALRVDGDLDDLAH